MLSKRFPKEKSGRNLINKTIDNVLFRLNDWPNDIV